MATGSFVTISIHRQIPVVAGYLREAPNFAKDRTSIPYKDVLNNTGVRLIRLGPTGGASTAGGKHGTQELIELPGEPISNYIETPPAGANVSHPMVDQNGNTWDDGLGNPWYMEIEPAGSQACCAIPLIYNNENTIDFGDSETETWITFTSNTPYIDIYTYTPTVEINFYVGRCNGLTEVDNGNIQSWEGGNFYLDISSYNPKPQVYLQLTGIVGTQTIVVEDD